MGHDDSTPNSPPHIHTVTPVYGSRNRPDRVSSLTLMTDLPFNIYVSRLEMGIICPCGDGQIFASKKGLSCSACDHVLLDSTRALDMELDCWMHDSREWLEATLTRWLEPLEASLLAYDLNGEVATAWAMYFKNAVVKN